MAPSTHWYVLTGRPCSGISTTLAALRKHGHQVVEEAARRVIDEEIALGRSVEDIRRDDVAFQRRVFERKLAIEQDLPKDEVFVLDRALPDSAAYHARVGLDPEEVLRKCQRDFYQKIFFLEPLPYIQDYARTEEGAALDQLGLDLRSAYLDLGYPVVSVPVAPVRKRVDWIREHLV